MMSSPASRTDALMTRTTTILVVDDDVDIRTSIGAILADEGYDVVLAENGDVALRALRRGLKPDVILLDLMMPVMDGFSFCQQWRDDATLHAIPVVVVSADNAAETKAARCGANGHMRKPIELDQLLDLCAHYASL